MNRVSYIAIGLLSVLGISAAVESIRTDPSPTRYPLDYSFIDRVVRSDDYVQGFSSAVARLQSRIRQFGPNRIETAAALRELGWIAHLGGDQTVAEEALTHADRMLREGASAPEQLAETVLRRGIVARYLDDRPLAAELFRDARRLLGEDSAHARLLADLAQAEASWNRVANPTLATRGYREALETRIDAAESSAIALIDNRIWYGHWLFRAGSPEKGLAQIRKAKAALEESGLQSHSLMGTILELEADRLALQDRWKEASDRYSRAAAIMRDAHHGRLPGFGRYHIRWSGNIGAAVSAVRAGRGEKALEFVAQSVGMTTLDFLRIGSWQQTEPRTFRTVAELRRSHADLLDRSRTDPSATTVEQLAARFALRARLYEEEQAFLFRASPQRTTLEDLQRHLDPATAIVGWLWYRPTLRADGDVQLSDDWAYVIRDTGPIRWVHLEEARSPVAFDERYRLSSLLGKKVRRAAVWPLRVPEDPHVVRLETEFGRRVIEPLLPHLDGVEVLLSDSPPSILDSLRVEGTQLIDRFSIAYFLGGLQSFTEIMSRSEDPRPRRAVFVGDPKPADRSTSKLPSAASEISNSSKLFPDAVVLSGADATQRNLEAALRASEPPKLVHFATHSLKNPRPEYSAMVLSADSEDPASGAGRLEVWEVMDRWNLQDSLVVLNGCDTACGNGLLGASCLGFPQAFLKSGARGLVSNLWPIDDRAGALLMERFYRNLTDPQNQGSSPVKALAEAKRWIRDYRDEAGDRPYAHPAYWAGFVLLGSPE